MIFGFILYLRFYGSDHVMTVALTIVDSIPKTEKTIIGNKLTCAFNHSASIRNSK